MSSINTTQGDGKDIESQTGEGTSTEQEATTSGIRTLVKVTENKEPKENFRAGKSLDELAARLTNSKDKFSEKQVDESKSLKDLSKAADDKTNFAKHYKSRSLSELSERLKKFVEYIGVFSTGIQNIEPPKTQVDTLNKNVNSKSFNELKRENDTRLLSSGQRDISITIPVASGSARSASNSLDSIDVLVMQQGEAIEDKESFVTVDPCQKEKTTSTEVSTIFSTNLRTQNIVAASTQRHPGGMPPAYTVRSQPPPPPPYEYTEPVTPYDNRGVPIRAPVYRAYTVEYIPPPQNVSQSPAIRRGDYDPLNLFNTREIRNQFVRKVYMLLALMLLITFGFTLVSLYEENTRQMLKKAKMWTMMVAFSIYTILLYIIICYQKVRRKFPLNLIILFSLAICMSYISALISCHYDTKIVMIAMGVTAGLCIVLSFLACMPWFDITHWGSILYIASMVLITYGSIAILIHIFTGSKIANLIFSGLMVLLFSMYLIYDTQRILGGRRFEISPEEYVLGALMLYIDIVYIFLDLLYLFGNIS